MSLAASLWIPTVWERATSPVIRRTSWLCEALWRKGRTLPRTRTRLKARPSVDFARVPQTPGAPLAPRPAESPATGGEGRPGICISHRRTQMLLMIRKVGETTRYTLFWIPCHRERNGSQPINANPKAVHQTRNAQTSSRACESDDLSGPRCP